MNKIKQLQNKQEEIREEIKKMRSERVNPDDIRKLEESVNKLKLVSEKLVDYINNLHSLVKNKEGVQKLNIQLQHIEDLLKTY